MDARLQSPLDYERLLWSRGLSRICGVDEVGRGPLAGPVVAAAVILPVECIIEGATDSKALRPATRERLFTEIRSRALAIGVGAASSREIDRLNILAATTLAMERALCALSTPPDYIVVDGLPVRGLSREHDAVVGGDARVHAIACASIVAKVLRDDLMVRLSRRWPGYGWERNMGYGTREHREGLARLGLTPHHRRSFRSRQLDLEL
jgi:ribonuclease HII